MSRTFIPKWSARAHLTAGAKLPDVLMALVVSEYNARHVARVFDSLLDAMTGTREANAYDRHVIAAVIAEHDRLNNGIGQGV
jgi:hypothetical protein